MSKYSVFDSDGEDGAGGAIFISREGATGGSSKSNENWVILGAQWKGPRKRLFCSEVESGW